MSAPAQPRKSCASSSTIGHRDISKFDPCAAAVVFLLVFIKKGIALKNA